SRVLRSRHDVDLRPLVQGHLGGEVCGATEPVAPEPPSRARAGATEGSVPDDARAQQRSGLVVGQARGDPVCKALVDDWGLGIPAIVIPSRERGFRTEGLVATPAE